MNPIPPIIPFWEVDLGCRARTSHDHIELLAADIEDSGLIQPIVLCEKTPSLVLAYEKEMNWKLDENKPYLLTAGGRRSMALDFLQTPFLYHAETSSPGRPGFVLRGEESSLLTHLLLEIKENLNRQDMDWRDNMKGLVKAWRYARRQSLDEGELLTCRTFGATFGVDYHDVQMADLVYEDFLATPQKYESANTMYNAYSIFLGKTVANALTTIAVARSYADDSEPTLTVPESGPNGDDVVAPILASQVIPITPHFHNVDCLEFMRAQPPGFCDHIICDPDYAIDHKILDSHQNNRPGVMDSGIAEKDAEQSLEDLFTFIPLAFRAIGPSGFLVMWYAIDHHEKLRDCALAAGFRVQRWPIEWNKMDFRGRSNASPHHNFPKSAEYAMVCRKPGTTLAKVQTSSLFAMTAESVVKELNHPFAKPYEVWRWIFTACCHKGQTVFDPFCGSGSSAIAAITHGLHPIGCEVQKDMYQTLILNLQTHYRKLLGPGVKFS